MSYRNITISLMIGGLGLLLFMVSLNAVSPEPTFLQVEDRVTRYYHNHPNPNDAGKPLARIAMMLLSAYELTLGGRGVFSYQILNIVIYAILVPSILIATTYWALKPLGPAPRPRGNILMNILFKIRMRRLVRKQQKELLE